MGLQQKNKKNEQTNPLLNLGYRKTNLRSAQKAGAGAGIPPMLLPSRPLRSFA